MRGATRSGSVASYLRTAWRCARTAIRTSGTSSQPYLIALVLPHLIPSHLVVSFSFIFFYFFLSYNNVRL